MTPLLAAAVASASCQWIADIETRDLPDADEPDAVPDNGADAERDADDEFDGTDLADPGEGDGPDDAEAEQAIVTVVFGDASGSDHPGTVQDTYLKRDAFNYSTEEMLNTYTFPVNTIANAVVILWDLSAIPPAAEIVQATLQLYMNAMEVGGGDDPYELSVHAIENRMPEISACTGEMCADGQPWTSCPGFAIPLAQCDIDTPEDVRGIDKSYGYKEWTVTRMVSDWMTGSRPNFGMLVNSDPVAASDSNRYFCSSEHADAEKRPRLVVSYRIQP